MSIIQEALKKAQTTYSDKGLQSDSASAEEATLTVSNEAPQAGVNVKDNIVIGPHRHAAIPFAALAPAVIVLTLIIGLGIKVFFLNTPAPDVKKETPESPAPAVNRAAAGVSGDNAFTGPKNSFMTSLMGPLAGGLTLNGIMYIGGEPRAIINGNIVEVGGSVGAAKIQAINEDNVLLNYGDREVVLQLKK